MVSVSIPLSWYLLVSAVLFSIGLFGVFARKNAIAILMSIELMLNAVNVPFVAFGRAPRTTLFQANSVPETDLDFSNSFIIKQLVIYSF